MHAKNITIPTAGEGRVIQHFGDSATQSAIRTHVGNREFNSAIGYLSAWNLAFPEARIYYDEKKYQITASYFDSTGALGYCIVAVFNNDTKQFGFHS